MSSPVVLPATSSTPTSIDAQNYPGLSAVKDASTQQALRLLHDLRLMLERKSVPIRGTLDPDQRPKLTPLRVGVLFYSTDFDRVFRWNGTSWEDAPGQPARGQVGFFLGDPGTGWARADGQAIVTTDSGGELVNTTAPSVDSISPLSPWIRL